MRFLKFIFLAALLSSCVKNQDVEILDYPIIPTIDNLTELYDLKLDASRKNVSTIITKYFDGSKEVTYTYDLTETNTYDPLYYSITVSKDISIKHAKETFSLEKNAIILAGKAFGQEVVPIDTLDLGGDDSYYALRTYEGDTNGVLFMRRDKKCIFTMIISGFYTTDNSILTELTLPRLKKLKDFDLK